MLGAGAMGCLWSALLAHSGQSVVLLTRARATVAEYSAIRLHAIDGKTIEVPLNIQPADDDKPIHRLLVCTKAFDTRAALQSVQARLAHDADVIFMQNGMGQHDQARATLPASVSLFAALTTEGAWLKAPLEVVHAGRGETRIGIYGLANTHLQPLTVALNKAAPTEAAASIEHALLEKLAINCAINPLTALYRCRNGELLSDAAIRPQFDALLAELEQIFTRLGYGQIGAELAERAQSVASATATNRSSMLQDVIAHKATEIEFITGYLVNRALAAGIDCPLNQALLARVRGTL